MIQETETEDEKVRGSDRKLDRTQVKDWKGLGPGRHVDGEGEGEFKLLLSAGTQSCHGTKETDLRDSIPIVLKEMDESRSTSLSRLWWELGSVRTVVVRTKNGQDTGLIEGLQGEVQNLVKKTDTTKTSTSENSGSEDSVNTGQRELRVPKILDDMDDRDRPIH